MRQSLDKSGQKAPILGFCQIKFWKKLADAKCQRWVVKEEADERLKKELEDSPMLKKYYEDEDLKSLLTDEPYLRGIDLEPYIFLSEAEVSEDEEVVDTDESLMEDLLNRDFIKVKHAADKVNKMPNLKNVQILNKIIPLLKSEDTVDPNASGNAAWALERIEVNMNTDDSE